MKVSFSDYAAGAGLATDLVNTSPLVWKSAGEMLGDPAGLADFLNEHGIDHPTPTPADLRQVHHLRDDLRAVLEAGTEDATAAGRNRIHLLVDDLEAEIAGLRSAGVTPRTEVVAGPGGYQVLVADPSGNLVELFQAAGDAPAP